MIELALPRVDMDTLRTIVGWLNNKELMHYSEQRHKFHTIGSQMEYIKSFIDHPDNILREIHLEGNLIGTINAYVDIPNRVANIGIMIGHGFTSKGYGYEAWAKLGDMLFDNLNMRRIESGCMAANTSMIKIFRHFGMKEEGKRMSHFMVDGTYSDLVLYGRFR